MRLCSIDFLRGLSLTMVLLDHLDFLVVKEGFFRHWTLMGLGFSDAAEAFVFLSGFTFGWVYSPRMAHEGFFSCQKRVLVRALQIYGGYLATVAVLASLGVVLGHSSLSMYPAIAVENTTMLREALLESLWLVFQPFGLGILCFYVVVLPFLPGALFLSLRRWQVALSLSLCVYAMVQFDPKVNLSIHDGTWHFNPFAWQFLLVLGMVCGQRGRDGRKILPRHSMGVFLAALMVLFGVLAMKGALRLFEPALPLHLRKLCDFWMPILLSKTEQAPFRLLHFLALAYLVSLILPKNDSTWRLRLVAPFVVCGRHSLSVYCVGTLLAYLSAIFVRWVAAVPFIVLIVGLDACLLQFAFAAWLDRGRLSRRKFRESKDVKIVL